MSRKLKTLKEFRLQQLNELRGSYERYQRRVQMRKALGLSAPDLTPKNSLEARFGHLKPGESASLKGNPRKVTKKKKTIEEAEQIVEVITKSTPTSTVIRDFIKSKAPQFRGKSKKERIRMALGAKYAMMRNEENILDEGNKENKAAKNKYFMLKGAAVRKLFKNLRPTDRGLPHSANLRTGRMLAKDRTGTLINLSLGVEPRAGVGFNKKVYEGFDDYSEIAKHLIKKHGKKVTKKHIEDLEAERDSQQKLDHDEILAHVKKQLNEEEYDIHKDYRAGGMSYDEYQDALANHRRSHPHEYEDEDRPRRRAPEVKAPHAVHINGKKWKTFSSHAHATAVARKILARNSKKQVTVHKED